MLRGSRPKCVWLAIADHFEPLAGERSEEDAAAKVGEWRRQWPEIAARCADSTGQSPVYTFFYPEEEYRPRLLDPLAEMTAQGIADVEVHIHHDGETEQAFVERVGRYNECLFARHGLLRKQNGSIRFGFIHGNWALDNSLPGGKWCGLNNEITLLRALGCYADFTMPAGAGPAQARMINMIYWANDDPLAPKSYDAGTPLQPGGPGGDLLIIPGPLGLRWRERLLPRIEKGEIACYDPPTAYRFRRWLELAPRLGEHVFIKLFTHGAQDRNSEPLLGGGLSKLLRFAAEECDRRGLNLRFVSTWQMYRTVAAIWKNSASGGAEPDASGVSVTNELAH